jgi:hypothetical protein
LSTFIGDRGIFEVAIVSSDGNGHISEESLRALPGLAAKAIEGGHAGIA